MSVAGCRELELLGDRYGKIPAFRGPANRYSGTVFVDVFDRSFALLGGVKDPIESERHPHEFRWIAWLEIGSEPGLPVGGVLSGDADGIALSVAHELSRVDAREWLAIDGDAEFGVGDVDLGQLRPRIRGFGGIGFRTSGYYEADPRCHQQWHHETLTASHNSVSPWAGREAHDLLACCGTVPVETAKGRHRIAAAPIGHIPPGSPTTEHTPAGNRAGSLLQPITVQPLIRASPTGISLPPHPGVRSASAHTSVRAAAPSGTVRVRDPLAHTGNTSLAMSSAAREAHRFSVAVMQLVCEVIGRHRGPSRLGETVAPAIADHIAVLVRHDAFHIAKTVAATAHRTQKSSIGPSVHRLHVQLCDPCGAEIFGSVTTDGQVRPFAARVERRPCRIRAAARPGSRSALGRVAYRWQLVALEFC